MAKLFSTVSGLSGQCYFFVPCWGICGWLCPWYELCLAAGMLSVGEMAQRALVASPWVLASELIRR
ncbi:MULTISPECIES: hypothetical protein [unclassified Thermosynechococcus]|uniref:hypothetical protein n=1 Tax=unclassified Thermosynechococcus TaxID=2622553 RepID=UPI00041449DE|nr:MULTISPECIES: hypothetical protein [unclassified Thermosynechococcus]HIK23755.1 hypothetical protein [Thermosynechococcus sp. M3746_W2019_013]